MAEPGVSVLISKSPCPLFERRMLKKPKKLVFQVVEENCDGCRRCITELGCTAFTWEPDGSGGGAIRIDENLCNACSVCSQICDAIKPKRLSA